MTSPIEWRPGYKRCRACGELKLLDEYHRNERSRDGRQASCASCCRAAERERYWRNPERSRQVLREKRAENPDRGRTWSRANYARRVEAAREYAKEYARKHAEERRAYLAAYRVKNRETIREKDRLYHAKRRAAKQRTAAALDSLARVV